MTSRGATQPCIGQRGARHEESLRYPVQDAGRQKTLRRPAENTIFLNGFKKCPPSMGRWNGLCCPLAGVSLRPRITWDFAGHRRSKGQGQPRLSDPSKRGSCASSRKSVIAPLDHQQAVELKLGNEWEADDFLVGTRKDDPHTLAQKNAARLHEPTGVSEKLPA